MDALVRTYRPTDVPRAVQAYLNHTFCTFPYAPPFFARDFDEDLLRLHLITVSMDEATRRSHMRNERLVVINPPIGEPDLTGLPAYQRIVLVFIRKEYLFIRETLLETLPQSEVLS